MFRRHVMLCPCAVLFRPGLAFLGTVVRHSRTPCETCVCLLHGTFTIAIDELCAACVEL